MNEQTPSAAQSPNQAAADAGNPGNGQASTPESSKPATPETPTPAPAAQAEGAQKPDASKPDSQQAPTVPEKYDLKASENSLLNARHLEKLAAEAKAQGLSQEDAQALVSLREQDVSDFVNEQKEIWAKQVAEDKELGGDNLKQSLALSARALEKLGTPELKAELDRTGYGTHPELVRMLVRIGKEIGNDTAHSSSARSTGTKTAAEIFYPNAKQEGA